MFITAVRAMIDVSFNGRARTSQYASLCTGHSKEKIYRLCTDCAALKFTRLPRMRLKTCEPSCAGHPVLYRVLLVHNTRVGPPGGGARYTAHTPYVGL